MESLAVNNYLTTIDSRYQTQTGVSRHATTGIVDKRLINIYIRSDFGSPPPYKEVVAFLLASDWPDVTSALLKNAYGVSVPRRVEVNHVLLGFPNFIQLSDVNERSSIGIVTVTNTVMI